jgi:uncharacterized membrane protein YfcA
MEIALIALVLLTLGASYVGTLTGFGMSTIMVPALLFFLPLPETLLFTAVVHLFGDVWKMLLFRKGVDWKLVAWFGVPGVVMSWLGASLSLRVPEVLLSRTLGASLVMYAVFLFARPSFKIAASDASAALGGALSGLLAGIFGIGGPPRAAFLAAFKLKKVAYVFASGAIAFAVDATRIAGYAFGGARLASPLVTGLLVAVPVSLLGALIAQKSLARVSEEAYRNVIAAFLLLVGLKLFLFP